MKGRKDGFPFSLCLTLNGDCIGRLFPSVLLGSSFHSGMVPSSVNAIYQTVQTDGRTIVDDDHNHDGQVEESAVASAVDGDDDMDVYLC